MKAEAAVADEAERLLRPRRIAATINLRRDLERLADENIERLRLPNSSFTFNRPDVGTLLDEWIKDAASLEDADEEVRLQFPLATGAE